MSRDYPPSKGPLTFCPIQKKLSPNPMWKTLFIHTDISSGGYLVSGTLYFYMFPNYVLSVMESTNVDTSAKLSYDITLIAPDRISVEVLFNIGKLTESLGILYFEKAKRGYVRKPIGLNAWACVDAKVEGLYTKDESITPAQIITECRKRITMAGL